MDFTLLSSIFTVISLIVFIGILYWAFHSKNKKRFDEMGRLPFDNENGS